MFNTLSAVTPDSFAKDVLQSDVPVVVDFWGPTCGPCKALAPMVEKFAANYEGRIKVVTVNSEEFRDFARDKGVRTMPTLMVYHQGELKATNSGLTAVAQTKLAVDKLL
jgi:thioredoxin 1